MRLTRILLNSNTSFKTAWEKFYFNLSHYNRYGLYTDDIADEFYDAEVQEAVRRLPPKLYDERNYRSLRAIQLSIMKEYLPKEKWITYEDDKKNGNYLQPYIKEVLDEWKERDDWEKNHP